MEYLYAEVSIVHACATEVTVNRPGRWAEFGVKYYDLCIEVMNSGDDSAVGLQVEVTLPKELAFTGGTLVIPTDGPSLAMGPTDVGPGRVTFRVPDQLSAANQPAGVLQANGPGSRAFICVRVRRSVVGRNTQPPVSAGVHVTSALHDDDPSNNHATIAVGAGDGACCGPIREMITHTLSAPAVPQLPHPAEPQPSPGTFPPDPGFIDPLPPGVTRWSNIGY